MQYAKAPGEPVADVHGTEDRARLIAAAPALLSALQELVQSVRDEFACSHPLCEVADRASAAIYAATKD